MEDSVVVRCRQVDAKLVEVTLLRLLELKLEKHVSPVPTYYAVIYFEQLRPKPNHSADTFELKIASYSKEHSRQIWFVLFVFELRELEHEGETDGLTNGRTIVEL